MNDYKQTIWLGVRIVCLSDAKSACWLSTKQMKVIPEMRRAHYIMCLSLIYIIAISSKSDLFLPRTTIHHSFICGQWGGMENTKYMWFLFLSDMVPCFQCFEEVQWLILIVINCNVCKVRHYDWKPRDNSLKSSKSNIAPTTKSITKSLTPPDILPTIL